jgi:hypothetical protein
MSNDGGPAFPHILRYPNDHLDNVAGGLTLRDYFAGQALAGWIANLRDAVDEYDGEDAAFMQHQHEVARTCYGYAGAMLKAREGTR